MTGVILDDLDGTVDRSTTLAVGLDVVCRADLAVDEVLQRPLEVTRGTDG